jgi:hypothetical protein
MRHEGFGVTSIGFVGIVGGLVRCLANTKDCMTKTMM